MQERQELEKNGKNGVPIGKSIKRPFKKGDINVLKWEERSLLKIQRRLLPFFKEHS